MKKLYVLLVMLLCSTPLACSAANSRAVIETNFGNITIELLEDKSPVTCNNFKRYIKKGFYNNTIFHRVLADFMIQGGGYTSSLQYKQAAEPIISEANNGLLNKRGTLAMARQYRKDTATSQFFINVSDNPHLDHRNDTNRGFGYAVFAKVISGMDVVDKISAVEVTETEEFEALPKRFVIVNSVKLIKNASQ